MSSRVGTLQGSQAGRSIWPAAVVALLIMLTIAVAAISLDRYQPRQDAQTSVGGSVANPSSAIRGGLAGGIAPSVVGGTAANTPSELSGGIRHKFASDESDAFGTNTPTELSGGTIHRPIDVNGRICGQCG